MTREVLGAAAAALSLLSLLPYLRDTLRGTTKPHVFTWFIWTLMTVIACAAQIVGGGGPGAWATAITAALCVPIFLAALRNGNKDITRSDWWSLAAAAVAGALWLVFRDPTASVVLVTIIDAVAFMPTIRKSVHRPYEETLSNYVLSAIKHSLSILALTTVSVTTAFYPAVVAAMNVVVVVLLITRRNSQVVGAQEIARSER